MEIPGIRNKAEVIFSRKITSITAIADKKIISVFYVSGVFFYPPHSVVQIK